MVLIILEKTLIIHFFIWSDNFDDIERYFDGDDFTYIKGENIKHDFYLFQFAKNFVVSPSTFHWWGAWLNNSDNKICLRPSNINPTNNTDFWPEQLESHLKIYYTNVLLFRLLQV